jgi:hypothetical protein
MAQGLTQPLTETSTSNARLRASPPYLCPVYIYKRKKERKEKKCLNPDISKDP